MDKAFRDRSPARSKTVGAQRATDVSSLPDKKRLRCVSELLRHLAHPARLKHNALAAPYFGKESEWRGEAETLAVRRIQRVIAGALETLTPRQQTIIERCDLGGERHIVAIQSLAISEGHFYRERRRALEVIARHLTTSATLGSGLRSSVLPDAFSVTCAHAFALEQVGRIDQAIDVLKAMTNSIDDPSQKVTGYCRLAELCATRGLPQDALRYAQLAGELAGRADWLTQSLRAEAAIARAMAIRHGGDECAAERIVTRTIVSMRALLSENNRSESQHAFGIGAILLAEQAIERGQSAAADRWLSEAITVIEHNRGAHSGLHLQLSRWRAFARMLIPRNLADATSELENLLAAALDAGLTVEAMTVATTLAAAYRLLQQPRKGIDILLTTLGLIRAALSGEDLGGALTELAEAYVASGEIEQALGPIAEIRSSPNAGSLVHALSFLLEAKIHLLRGEALHVLRASHSAIERLTVLGRVRLVGQALRLQALALEAVGDHANALTSIDVAVEQLEAFGTPWIALTAQIDAARLRGDRVRLAMLTRQQAELTAVSNGQWSR